MIKTTDESDLNENEISNYDTLKMLIQIFREKYPHCLDAKKEDEEYVTFVKDRAINDFRYRIDSSKLKKLGWTRKVIDFKTMFEKTVAWYMENKNHWENVDYALEAHPMEQKNSNVALFK